MIIEMMQITDFRRLANWLFRWINMPIDTKSITIKSFNGRIYVACPDEKGAIRVARIKIVENY